jgi:diguanylate cyclase (GGDEF)-like protein/PAS domain S-box-containing protein
MNHMNSTSILSEIGIDADEVAARQAFLEFTETDVALLKELHGQLALQQDVFSESFYAHLQRFPEMLPLLGDSAKLERLKRTQAKYFNQLTEGCYDRQYIENRLHVGLIHQRVGLTPKWYMSAYCKYLSDTLPVILQQSNDAPDQDEAARNKRLASYRALLKIIFFDMGLALDTYFHSEHQALAMARGYTDQIVANMPLGFVVLDSEHKIRLANHAVLRMFDMEADTVWQGYRLADFLGIAELNAQLDLVLKNSEASNNFGFERFDSHGLKSYLADISPVQMGGERVILFMVQDITARKQSEGEIHRLAFYDALTKLPNRRLLHERLIQSMSISARSGKFGALMFLDLDNFKTINDTQGHDVGDQLLREVAGRLGCNVREGDTVARLGGDEFVVALESLSSNSTEAANQAEQVAEKIRYELSQPYLLNGNEHHSSPSIGVSLFRGHQNSLDEILKQADLAMYQAKARGRNMVCFFDPAMQAALENRAALESDLRVSIRQDQLVLYYQMQVDESAHIHGAEVLLRWRHPERGLVPPAEFILLAEETGMILQIGDWVIEQACKQLKAWEMDPVMRHIELAVNVSPRQLGQPYFVEQVKEVIEKTGIRPSRLKLELTEGFILNDVEDAIEKMLELKAIGIRFSMDDFGTGYSSLSYLNRLPLDQLKIDQSFVRDITHDKNSRAMVRTIISIATNFGLNIIAEGVETDAQLAYLMQYGCNEFQGYLFGKAVPLQEFEQLCRRQ